MEDLNNVPSSGTYGAAINKVNANFSLIVNAINSLEYATTKSKGILNYGTNPATEFPNASEGDWCMILSEGNVFPATIKTYNGTSWIGSGQWNPSGIDLTGYATTSALNTAVANSLAQATARMGYGIATANGNNYSVSITNYTLPTNGGSIRIQMPTQATGASTLNVSDTGAKTILYNNLTVSSANTWEEGEIINVFYDGQNYRAYNAQGGGGGKFSSGEKVSETSLIDVVNSSSNIPKSSAINSRLTPIEAVAQTINKQELVLFEYELKDNYYYKGSSYTSNTSFCSTEKIDVSGYSKIYIGAETTSTHNVSTILIFNGNTVISSAYYTLQKYREITLPSGATHVIVNTFKSTCHYPVVLHATIGESKLDEIDDIKNDVYETRAASLEFTTESGFLNGTGTGLTSNSSFKTTNYIDVSELDSILITASGPSLNGIVYAYNSEQQAMFWLLGKGTYTSQNVNIPAEVKYVRVSGSTSNFFVQKRVYIPKSDSFQSQIDQIKEDIYTAFKEITYDESQNKRGFWQSNGTTFKSYSGYTATPFIPVTPSSTIYIDTKSSTSGVNCLFSYGQNQNYIRTIKTTGTFNKTEVQLADTEYYIKMNGQGVTPKVFKKGVGSEASKKKLNFNINWVGMSIWWYDGKTLGSGAGGGVTAKGYQSLLREQYQFLSDTGTNYCVSGASLGGTSASDSLSLAANMTNWSASQDAIWTLDTITNDFKRNIPIGTTTDYDEDTGVTTYLGALRKFADKVTELSGSSAIVVASNGARRNNSGYTSTSQNSNGNTMQDFEKALMYVVMKKGWYFVDQYRLSALSDNVIVYATIDGLHLNNTGYKLAVIPWIAVFDMIYNRYL